MTAIICDKPRFSYAPDEDFVKNFIQHLQQTQEPETFPRLIWTPPPAGLIGSVLLHPFTVDRGRRNQRRVPCAQCDGRKKFYKGALIWSPDGEIRLIGDCCAKEHFGDAYAIMHNNFDEKERQKREREFLEKNLGLVPTIQAELAKLSIISEIMAVNRNKLKGLNPTYQFFVSLKKTEGKLQVSEKKMRILSGVKYTDEQDTELILKTIHFVQGLAFFDRSNPRDRYHYTLKEITNLAVAAQNDNWQSDIHLQKEIAKSLQRSSKEVLILHNWLKEAVAFFTESNLAALRAFGEHPLPQGPRFRVRINPGKVIFIQDNPRGAVELTTGEALHVPEINLPPWRIIS